MARRSKRQGAPFFGANLRLPLTHESVHRISGRLEEALWQPPGVPVGLDDDRGFDVRGALRDRLPLAKQPFRFQRFAGLKVLSLRVPSRVRFCIRRKERRSILFAYRKVGYRGSSPGRRGYRRVQDSQYSCR